MKISRINQNNYSLFSTQYGSIDLNSTMFLAYRDIPQILRRHFLSPSREPGIYGFLDYGCGPGKSTELLLKIFNQLNINVKATGVDINSANIQTAQARLPHSEFKLLKSHDLPTGLGRYDIITCFFVLLENDKKSVKIILNNIHHLLKKDGIAIITNCNAKIYNNAHSWYSIDNR
ncbi:MAG: class I SAM-dependent methyltransferase, partial [Proteobacteria bacterium]|nr:class I SAM-dependent methyltransferase [Pseudomonadota bacterium]